MPQVPKKASSKCLISHTTPKFLQAPRLRLILWPPGFFSLPLNIYIYIYIFFLGGGVLLIYFKFPRAAARSGLYQLYQLYQPPYFNFGGLNWFFLLKLSTLHYFIG